MIVFWAEISISSSTSTKGSPRRAAIRRPTDDFPQPINPTITIERWPSASRNSLTVPASTHDFIARICHRFDTLRKIAAPARDKTGGQP